MISGTGHGCCKKKKKHSSIDIIVWMQQLVKARPFTLIRNGELTFSNGFSSPQKFLRQFLWVCYKVVAFHHKTKKNHKHGSFLFGCSNNLFSRAVSSKVFSALVSLTSVFGMRTGGTSPLTSPQWYIHKAFALNISLFRVQVILYTFFIFPSIYLHGRLTTA